MSIPIPETLSHNNCFRVYFLTLLRNQPISVMPMLTIPKHKLNTGALIPGVGLGCGPDGLADGLLTTKPWILTGIKVRMWTE